MNIYKYKFKAKCLVDGKIINYKLKIKTDKLIEAERIIESCENLEGFQENIAANLKQKLTVNGEIILTVVHSGVKIKTRL